MSLLGSTTAAMAQPDYRNRSDQNDSRGDRDRNGGNRNDNNGTENGRYDRDRNEQGRNDRYENQDRRDQQARYGNPRWSRGDRLPDAPHPGSTL